MKRFLQFAAVVLAVTATACKQKNADLADDTLKSDGRDVAVELGSNIRVNTAKGAGAVDAWAKQNLYVFGYRRASYRDSYPPDFTNAFIDGVCAQAPSGSLEGRISLYNQVSKDGKLYAEPFYYGYSNGQYATYNFYACYFDDAVKVNDGAIAGLEKTKEQVAVPYEIDGTQDLMTAYANQIADVKGTDVNAEYAYSGFSARSGVTPNLKFRHCLSQFRFNLTNRSNANLRLDSIKFNSYSKGRLVICNRDTEKLGIVPDESSTVDFLCSYQNGGKAGLALPVRTNNGGEDVYTSVSAGSLLVTPKVGAGSKATYRHDISVYLSLEVEKTELDKNGNVVYEKDGKTPKVVKEYQKMDAVPYAITPELVVPEGGKQGDVNKFEAGKYYNVNISVYSWEKIEVLVSLTEWVDGGAVDIDPDDDPGFGE